MILSLALKNMGWGSEKRDPEQTHPRIQGPKPKKEPDPQHWGAVSVTMTGFEVKTYGIINLNKYKGQKQLNVDISWLIDVLAFLAFL